MSSSPLNLQEWFGGIDIYLFDQLLKGRIVPGMRVLDAGCGPGRNLVYLLKSEFEVFGVDESSDAVAQTRRVLLAKQVLDRLADNAAVRSLARLMTAGEERQPAQAGHGDIALILAHSETAVRTLVLRQEL